MARIMRGVWEGLFPIRRSDLEYPTEDVTFTYLSAINKITYVDINTANTSIVVNDKFIDKSIEIIGVGDHFCSVGRWSSGINGYIQRHYTGNATADHDILRLVSGTATELGYEAVDLNNINAHLYRFSISGSTLKGYRDNLTTPKITVTDTTYASGMFGIRWSHAGLYPFINLLYVYLRPPSTQLPPALTIIEVEVTGSGSEDDPIRPNFTTDIRDHPEFGKIDRLSVTFGAFDYKGDSTMLCIVKGGNPYNAKAIETQILYAKSKNKIVEKPPKDLRSAEELHTKLKREFSEWIAGKHDFAYQCLGYADLEPLAVADFYDGIAEGYYGKDPLKNVPEWELERTINMWREKLKRANVSAELKEKHERKLKRVLKS